jgi:hypothetical protein
VALHAADLPAGADPADLITTPGGVALLRAALHRPPPAVHTLIEHRLRTYYQAHDDWPDCAELHVGAVHAVAGLLTHVDVSQLDDVIDHVARTTRTAPDVVWPAIETYRRQHARDERST